MKEYVVDLEPVFVTLELGDIVGSLTLGPPRPRDETIDKTSLENKLTKVSLCIRIIRDVFGIIRDILDILDRLGVWNCLKDISDIFKNFLHQVVISTVCAGKVNEKL